ncbi:MAG: hypothetical protein DCC67_09950 [Planctomycetota bacterium]|nr:MAG: hypothetical protein DCC67_09950 [Planctomycetota bacterium]
MAKSAAVWALLMAAGAGRAAVAQAPPTVAATDPDVPIVSDQLAEALDRLEAFLGQNENAARWQRYLRLAELRQELHRGSAGNPAVLGRVLQRFRGRQPGLELLPFAVVRRALESRLDQLNRQYSGDLTQLAWDSRADYVELSSADFDDVRADLRRKAAELMQWLSGNPPVAAAWRKYLKWNLLEPHLRPDFEVTPRSLAELDEVLERFRANQPGLEMPRFLATAEAIARYRVLGPWALTARTRDTRVDYQRLLESLRTQLQRHAERPTSETAWKVGRILGTIDQLDRTPWLISLIRQRYARPNIAASVSANLVRRLPDRPANQVRPVRDCILGTSIFGTATTRGDVYYQLQPSDASVQLALHVEGVAYSQTNGYNGPVRIRSSGTTPFTAVKQITLTDDAFKSGPAVVAASTHTHIHAIRKTGGRLGSRVIEKVAWRRAMEQKGLAERIAARHAEQRIAREVNEQVEVQLAAMRRRYEQEFAAPLARRAISPEYVNLSSTPQGVGIQTIFARRNQLGAATPPPAAPGNDILIQVHQSAVNNYLPLALARARISQQSADRPVELEGDVPNWIRGLSIASPGAAAIVDAGREVVEQAQEAVEDLTQSEEEQEAEARQLPPFKPFSITLNAEAPASVQFDDGKLTIRVRAATLVSDADEYANWDFIVVYQVELRDDQILLRRVGKIEAFPTGFDPAWDKQLTAQQAGFRSTLAKNMNARADAGQSFPAEIPIQPLQVTRLGTLLVRQLEVDDGWLTIGWILPPQAPPLPPGQGILGRTLPTSTAP